MPCSATPSPDAPDPLRVEPAWLTETVFALARGVAADLGFDRLPILADALEDAGCDNFPLLKHLRHEHEHRVECWALRRLLRTTLTLPGGVPITFAYCPSGSFLMGSDHSNVHFQERPTHRVTLTKGFCAGITPISQQQWRAVMGTDPSEFKGSGRPVERVSWLDAGEFCQRAAELTEHPIRLPTEAEWEYACRAGTMTEFHFGEVISDQLANYMADHRNGSPEGEYRAQTTAVGIFPPNAWGLYDCHGNVWEWCADWYDAGYYARSPICDPECRDGERTHRILRGGSWDVGAKRCRASDRNSSWPADRYNDYGFRVVFTAT